MFKAGLAKPLHFFPVSSLEYVQQEQLKGKSKTTALTQAQKKWLGSDYARGESDDPYYDICFKMTDPLDQSFEEVSKAVFGPLLANGTVLDT
jgi:exodeoxyribonuclease V gamma subunit